MRMGWKASGNAYYYSCKLFCKCEIMSPKFFLKIKKHLDWKNKREVLGQKAREPRRDAGLAASTCFEVSGTRRTGPASPPSSLLGSQQGQGSSMDKGHLSPSPQPQGRAGATATDISILRAEGNKQTPHPARRPPWKTLKILSLHSFFKILTQEHVFINF